jgi:hypothetical protein
LEVLAMHWRGVGSIDTAAVEHLRARVAPCETLADVLDWARVNISVTAIREICDSIVQQDEYCSDVVVAFDEQLFLVFDTT